MRQQSNVARSLREETLTATQNPFTTQAPIAAPTQAPTAASTQAPTQAPTQPPNSLSANTQAFIKKYPLMARFDVSRWMNL